MSGSSFRLGCGLALVALLPGCMQGYDGAGPAPASIAGPQGMALRAAEDSAPVIETLARRPGAIVPGTPYAAIARAVLEGGSFRASSELRVARLRGEAEELAWLPELGPVLSLAALQRMSERVRARPEGFDTLRKQAERDLALAGIDSAALALAEEANVQVFEAIGQHLSIEEARARAALFAEVYPDFAALDWPMHRAVAGGTESTQRLQALRAQVARVRAGRVEALEQAERARGELAAMGDSRLGGVEGLGTLRELVTPVPLPDLQARVARAAQEAQELRAAHVLLDGLDLRRSPEELAALEEVAGYAGEGSDAGGWTQEVGAPVLSTVLPGDFELGVAAQERATLQARLREAQIQHASAAAEAQQARQLQRAGQMTAGRLLEPLSAALDAREAQITLQFALARAELRLAYLRGTLVAGSAL